MENEFAITKREEAYIVHNRILANGKVLQTTLLEVCKDLKRMRDEALYKELGYESFEAYSENACGIRQRQAYSYISAYEKLGESYIQENASLGITKLELISQVASYDREEFIEDVKPEEISTRELKDKVAEYKSQTEQLTLDLSSAEEKAEALEDENKALLEKISELEEQHETQTEAPSDEAIEAAVEKERKRQEAILDAEKKKHDLEMKSALSKAEKDAVKDAEKAVKEKLAKLKKKNKQLNEQLEQAQKQAKVAGADEDTIAIRILFADLQSTANQITERLTDIAARDKEKADRLAALMQDVINDLFKGGAE